MRSDKYVHGRGHGCDESHGRRGFGGFGFGRGMRGGGFGPGWGARHEGRGHGRRGGGRLFDHGTLRWVLLSLIADKPSHGYELIKAVETKLGGAYSPSPGVIYPTLTLLEETGEIEAAAFEGNKRLYSITDKGRQTVEDNRAAIDAVLKRFADATRAPNRNPRLIRAIENLRLSLRLKGEAGELDAERMSRLIDLLDATARQIDEI